MSYYYYILDVGVNPTLKGIGKTAGEQIVGNPQDNQNEDHQTEYKQDKQLSKCE